MIIIKISIDMCNLFSSQIVFPINPEWRLLLLPKVIIKFDDLILRLDDVSHVFVNFEPVFTEIYGRLDQGRPTENPILLPHVVVPLHLARDTYSLATWRIETTWKRKMWAWYFRYDKVSSSYKICRSYEFLNNVWQFISNCLIFKVFIFLRVMLWWQ